MELIEGRSVIAYRIQSADEGPGDEMSIRVGLTRVWTDENYRRKSIASRLVDMVRFHSGIPGSIISRDQLGILEPSEDGKVFFRNYTGGQGGIYSYNRTPNPNS